LISRFRGSAAHLGLSHRGSLILAYTKAIGPGFPNDPSGWSYRSAPAVRSEPLPPWGVRTDMQGWTLRLPHAVFVVAFSALPVVGLIRRRRQGPLTCLTCGYDLRGSESRTCPECGAERRPKPHPNRGVQDPRPR
jgi:hypothetical protein